MPFTPYHLGPALAIGLPLRKHLHTPTFIIANIIVDIEPFIIIIFNLKYPLHGYLHTIVGGIILGVIIGYIMKLIEKIFHPLWRKLLLTPKEYTSLRSYIIPGILGILLHISMDIPLYHEMKPFYPIIINPFYNPQLTKAIYELCIFMGIVGLLYYFYLITITSIQYGLLLLGLSYIVGSLYIYNLYIYGLHDISLTLLMRIPLIIGLIIIIASIPLFIGKIIKISFPIMILSLIISSGWISYLFIEFIATNIVTLTPLLLTLIISIITAHIVTILQVYKTLRGIKE